MSFVQMSAIPGSTESRPANLVAIRGSIESRPTSLAAERMPARPDPNIRLFITKSDNGIDPGGAAGGEPTGQQGDACERDDRDEKSRRIEAADVIEQTR